MTAIMICPFGCEPLIIFTYSLGLLNRGKLNVFVMGTRLMCVGFTIVMYFFLSAYGAPIWANAGLCAIEFTLIYGGKSISDKLK
jgi:hypothetical protein